MECRLFQLTIFLLSLVPIMEVSMAFTQGPGYLFPDGGSYPNDLDNQYRYVTGTYLAVTFAIWWTLGNIEERIVPIRIVCAAVFIGGIGRLISIQAVGMPESPDYLVGAFIELVLVPLLLLWQVRLRRKATET